MSHGSLWIIYLIGIGITNFIKWVSYCYGGKSHGKRFMDSSNEWFMEATLRNAASWIATLLNAALALTVGRIYIDRLPVWDWLGSIPLDWTITLALAISVEIILPNVCKFLVAELPEYGTRFAKWFVSKLPGQ